ncbi:MAG: hypothetical protein IJZ76_06165 [Lachnospiraceae bacterium]|nr:hypothetical protein [Lachnospiraceae bacterium]
MKKKVCLLLLMTGIICMCVACNKVSDGATSTQNLIVEVLEEKYPEKTFEVIGQESLYYNVVDGAGIRFQVEPIQVTQVKFWCTDNYLDAYFQANGTVEQCNEILEQFGIENKVELGEPFEVNLGVIDDERNRTQMESCLDELGELLKVPFEVTYYDKGTPQQGEKYQGSSTVGTFSYISLDYTFQEPHIRTFVGEGTIAINDIQKVLDGHALIENILVQVNEYDIIGEALEPEFYAQIKEAVEAGERPVEVYEDDYRHFDISIEMIHTKITSNTDASILTIENEGEDENGNVVLRVMAENGDELFLHLGKNEEVAYSYKLNDLYMAEKK